MEIAVIFGTLMEYMYDGVTVVYC